jgi:hypothetical protein
MADGYFWLVLEKEWGRAMDPDNISHYNDYL